MTNNNNPQSSDGDSNNNKRRLGKKEARKNKSARQGANNTVVLEHLSTASTSSPISDREVELFKRIAQLEHMVARQSLDIRKLKQQCQELQEASTAFLHVMEMLRAAGLDTDKVSPQTSSSAAEKSKSTQSQKPMSSQEEDDDDDEDETDDERETMPVEYEYFDDTEIFGAAPSSVIDAADAAGASILAGLLGGKQRMLVDVRDNDLGRDPETLVQFIELAILPVAAGLEGLRSNRNRVKIVFPTVSQLLEYRRTMALAAPEVVALSTLGFDPVEERDNLVVVVAPAPDNEEGLKAMNELLDPPEWKKEAQITQPIVVLNHHMVPLSGPSADYEVMYHLRLLSVSYMSSDFASDFFQRYGGQAKQKKEATGQQGNGQGKPFDSISSAGNTTAPSGDLKMPEDAVLEAAMKHAHEAGVNQGLTRAMVIRSYPNPWHVWVDTSPGTDADFVVAATFDEEPSLEDVNAAIVECLEGSEEEDEIVAQQMQQVLENKELDIMKQQEGVENLDKDDKESENDDESDNGDTDDDADDDDDLDLYDLWNEDSI